MEKSSNHVSSHFSFLENKIARTPIMSCVREIPNCKNKANKHTRTNISDRQDPMSLLQPSFKFSYERYHRPRSEFSWRARLPDHIKTSLLRSTFYPHISAKNNAFLNHRANIHMERNQKRHKPKYAPPYS